jgi:alkaline phosphatase
MNTVMKFEQYCKILFIHFFFCHYVQSQQVLIHSHNDYQQPAPFYQAYACKVYSIEVDIFHSGADELLVAHEVSELSTAKPFDDLYMEPIVELFKQNKGKAWKDSDGTFQLLIDLKTSVVPTLDILVSKLNAYPDVFNPAVNAHAVRIVISGNRPELSAFSKYPSYIFFDGDIKQTYTPDELRRVALFSEPFDKYSKWNGKGYIIDSEKKNLEEAIQKAHSMGKPIRFWGAPDNITAWNVFYTMGVDYINTDKPEACATFSRGLNNKSFSQ